MSRKTANNTLIVGGILFILYIGLTYLISPESIAPGFGMHHWPTGDGDGFLRVKGIRDTVSGLVLTALLLSGQRRAMGWVLLVEGLTPVGDMIDVLSHHGSAVVALSVHGLTAVWVFVAGALTLRENHSAATTSAPAYAPLPAVA